MIRMRLNLSKFADGFKALVPRVRKAERKALARFGAFVRRRAKSSIRKGKKPSVAGEPPRSHLELLRKGILFAVEDHHGAAGVIIGPAKLPGKSEGILRALEEGGESEVIIQRRRRRHRGDLALGRKPERASLKLKLAIRPRPFMLPAFEKEKAGAAALFENSVK